MPPKTTHTISGREISLRPGRRYAAYGPVGIGLRTGFIVSILDITQEKENPVDTIEGFSWDDGEAFVREFNTDPNVSFQGRVWV